MSDKNKLLGAVKKIVPKKDEQGFILPFQGGRFRLTDELDIVDTGIVDMYVSEGSKFLGKVPNYTVAGSKRTYQLPQAAKDDPSLEFVVPAISTNPVSVGLLNALVKKPLPLTDDVLLSGDIKVKWLDSSMSLEGDGFEWSVEGGVEVVGNGSTYIVIPAPVEAVIDKNSGAIIQMTDGAIMKEGDNRDSLLFKVVGGTLAPETRTRAAAMATGHITLSDEGEFAFFDGNQGNVDAGNIVPNPGITEVTAEEDGIIMVGAPIASFSWTVNELEVTFTDGSVDSNGSVDTYAWDFGDGNTSDVQNPVHTYAEGGHYTVTLKVTDNDGNISRTYTGTVSARANRAPMARFSADREYLVVSFEDISIDGDGTIASHAWTFGDGNSSTDANPVHTYTADGDYEVELKVTDNKGVESPVYKKMVSVASDKRPTASFTSANLFQRYTFTDASTGQNGSYVAQWYWDFGDGNTSNEQNPVHEYATAGTYEVRLYVLNQLGERSEEDYVEEVTVVLNEAPVANFTVIEEYLQVTLGDTSTDADGTIASYAWDFGDGNTSTDASPVHTYDAAGFYTISLVVTDDFGTESEAHTQQISVAPLELPTSSFSQVTTKNSVAFTDTSVEGTHNVVSYAWNFGDTNTSTDQNPTHAYATDGMYTVSLVVTDDQGNSSTAFEADVTIDPFIPTAAFSEVINHLEVTFTDESTDPDGIVNVHAWDFGDGATSTDQNPVHTYATGGTYTAGLTVTDEDGNASTQVTKSITVVANVAPTAAFTSAINGLEVTLTNTSTDSDGSVASYAWDFGDGNSSTDENPVHTYASAGTYTVSLVVTDDDGTASVAATESVTV